MNESLIDPSARLYGTVELGADAIIDANVVLGQPAAGAVLRRASTAGHYEDTQAFFASVVGGRTTSIGHGALIRSGSVIYAGTAVGNRFDCGHNVIVREDTRIGDRVYVKNNTEIMKHVRIGSGCRLAGVIADKVVIGNRVSSFGTLTHAYPRYLPPSETAQDILAREHELAAPTVEDDVIIGRGAVIIGGVTIGAGALIAANAVVTFDVARGERVGASRGWRRPPRVRRMRGAREAGVDVGFASGQRELEWE